MQTPNGDITKLPSIDTEVRPGKVVSGIQEAAATTGVSFGYLLAQATQESGLDPHAASATSSAAGLYQFTTTTWLDMVRRHGAKHGLGEQAAAIVKDGNGHLNVADKAQKKAILDLRKDPKLSSLMAAELAKDNAKSLERRLGRQATAADLTLAHFLGAAGAARVIQEMETNPRHSARRLLPEAAKANPELFGEARTVAGLYKNVQARLKDALGNHAAAAHQPVMESGNAQLAALRPQARPEPAAQQPTLSPQPTPTETAVAQVAIAVASQPAPNTVTAADFARAVQPESPFFPAPIPPPPAALKAYAARRDDSPYFPAAIPPAPTPEAAQAAPPADKAAPGKDA